MKSLFPLSGRTLFALLVVASGGTRLGWLVQASCGWWWWWRWLAVVLVVLVVRSVVVVVLVAVVVVVVVACGLSP